MKETGVLRPVDRNGRVVIPIEFRKLLKMQDDTDFFEIFAQKDQIVLKKYVPSCVFCGESEDTVSFGGKLICKHCIDELQKAKEDSENETFPSERSNL